MPEKSIWQRISNPRETYTDGYGTQREVYEPGYITVGRKMYNELDRFINPAKDINIKGGAGALELLNMPIGFLSKTDDIAALTKNIDKIKDLFKNVSQMGDGIYGFSTASGKWVPLTKRAAQLQEGNAAKYAFYGTIGKQSMPSKIASRKTNLVEKGIDEYGNTFVIRKNEYADPSNLSMKKELGPLKERYSSPDEWATSGTGSQIRRGK